MHVVVSLGNNIAVVPCVFHILGQSAREELALGAFGGEGGGRGGGGGGGGGGGDEGASAEHPAERWREAHPEIYLRVLCQRDEPPHKLLESSRITLRSLSRNPRMISSKKHAKKRSTVCIYNP